MSLRNENIGVVVGALLVIAGQLITGGDPSDAEAALIAIVGLGAVFVISDRLNERDRKRGRERDRLPFKR